jgi:hypothetical protein
LKKQPGIDKFVRIFERRLWLRKDCFTSGGGGDEDEDDDDDDVMGQ